MQIQNLANFSAWGTRDSTAESSSAGTPCEGKVPESVARNCNCNGSPSLPEEEEPSFCKSPMGPWTGNSFPASVSPWYKEPSISEGCQGTDSSVLALMEPLNPGAGLAVSIPRR